MDYIDDVKQCATMFAAFRTLLRAYNEFLSAAVSEYALSPNEIVVLSSLWNVSSASQIAKEADVSKALVSRSVKLLKQKGLIDVTISAIDKREQDLRLTGEGVKAAERIARANESFCANAMHNVEARAVELTQLLLKLIMNNLDVDGRSENDDSEE